jgi:hypothetical protein
MVAVRIPYFSRREWQAACLYVRATRIVGSSTCQERVLRLGLELRKALGRLGYSATPEEINSITSNNNALRRNNDSGSVETRPHL